MQQLRIFLLQDLNPALLHFLWLRPRLLTEPLPASARDFKSAHPTEQTPDGNRKELARKQRKYLVILITIFQSWMCPHCFPGFRTQLSFCSWPNHEESHLQKGKSTFSCFGKPDLQTTQQNIIKRPLLLMQNQWYLPWNKDEYKQLKQTPLWEKVKSYKANLTQVCCQPWFRELTGISSSPQYCKTSTIRVTALNPENKRVGFFSN